MVVLRTKLSFLNMKKNVVISAILSFVLLQSCTVVRPGEAAVKQKVGKLDEKVYIEQAIWFNPFTTSIIKTSIQTNNLELSLNIPSKEGLSINSQISILLSMETFTFSGVVARSFFPASVI